MNKPHIALDVRKAILNLMDALIVIKHVEGQEIITCLGCGRVRKRLDDEQHNPDCELGPIVHRFNKEIL